MKPVDQTICGLGGNCFAACVASILELKIDQVPNFCECEDTWFADFSRWVARRGYTPLFVKADAVRCRYIDICPLLTAGHYLIVSGLSPRGDFMHAVVEHRGAVVHDPHPSRAGFVGAWQDFIVLIPNSLSA